MFHWTSLMQFWQPIEIIAKPSKAFSMKSEDEKNKKQNVQKTIFLKLLISTHRVPF